MRIKNQYKLTYLLVHIDLIFYLFNKLYKIQVIQNIHGFYFYIS